MTTTARQATCRIITDAAVAAELAISGFDTCDMCPRTAGYLYARTDEYGTEVRVCEHCVTTNTDLGCIAD